MGCHCRRQDLFKYRRDEGGFTGWLATRLPHIPQSSAYRAIEIARNIDAEMFTSLGNIRPGILEQIAKAEPDIQALIAERVRAGEIFTAAERVTQRGGAGGGRARG
jgi:hypothetical protein